MTQIPEIKFGTDGWRALIARDFTFETVTRVAHAVAAALHESAPDKKRMIVGHDRRFLSREFAQTVATVYANEGYEVLLAPSFLPTPALSWAAKNEPGVVGATVITASHNPAAWNGFKFKEPFGGSAHPKTTKAFETKIAELGAKSFAAPTSEDFDRAAKSGKIRTYQPLEQYLEAVKKLIDLDRIRKAKLRVGLDVMHGAASGHLASLLRSNGVEVTELHGEDNPGFRGVPPEPIEKNLMELCAAVAKNDWACGLATDGDADRLGAVDEDGSYFSTQQILSVAYWHMLQNRKKKWSIARSVSTTRMVDLVAKRAGQKCFETPVGFKFIAEKMVNGEAQIGGEESGGIGIIDHLPERDGLLTALLLLELVATAGKGLRAVYDDLCKAERPYYFTRNDIHLTVEQARSVVRRLTENPPDRWQGRPVETLSKLDGFKFYLRDGSWILIRPSGTEPIFRIYAEAESLPASEQLTAEAKKFVETI
ncbi:MAG TPA: phosphoglucomutase/phosphomannomutase family protein [Bdellovibrionota bacterium]|nr:phosphoglucomutase/phosphomannomutase family protein [Bdellovibrionota bacterium]